MVRKNFEFTVHKTSTKLLAMVLLVVIVLASLVTACAAPAPTSAPTSPAPAPAAPKTIELKFATWAPEQEFTSSHYRWFAQELEKRTNGRVKVQLFWAAALGNTPELPENLQKGVTDMAVFVPEHVPGLMPVAELMGSPMLIPTATLMGYIGEHLFAEGMISLKGVKLLQITGHESILMATTKKQIKTLADFKGLVLGGPGTWGPILSKLGASEMLLPPPEIYTSLERGVVDGGPFGMGLIQTFKLDTVMKYFPTNLFGNGAWAIGINEGKWNSLPADVQAIMLDLNRESSYKFTALIEQQNTLVIDYIKSNPNAVIYTIPDDVYGQLLQMAIPAAQDKAKELDAKGVPATKALGIIMSDLKAMGVIK